MKFINLKNHRDLVENIIFISVLLLNYVIKTSISCTNKVALFVIIVVAISMFRNIFISCMYGFFGGILCDFAMDTSVGLNVTIFVIIGALVSVLTIYYFKINMFSFLIFSTISVIVEYLFVILFKYNGLKFYEYNIFVVKDIIPSIFITVLVSPLIFLFFLYINDKVLSLE